MWLVCCLCLFSLALVCRAVPINRELHSSERVGGLYFDGSSENFANESVCVSDDVLYKEGDPIPTAALCERCVCRPPDIVCEAIRCELRPGCRTLHRPNQCCPELKCECEANGIIYHNGQRLEVNSPCKACYCKSGEIVCTVIECYQRADCEPHNVTGKCCPTYDHCPPVDPTPMTFYTTPATSSESINPSSTDYAAHIAEMSSTLEENIQDNVVDSSKKAELLGGMSDSPEYGSNTSNDYDQDISLKVSSTETSSKEELPQDNTDVYAESTVSGETSRTKENSKEQQRDNSEVYTESVGNGGTQMLEENDRKEVSQETNEFSAESTVSGETSKIEENSKELQRDNAETDTGNTGTEEIREGEENDREKVTQETTDFSTESTVSGESSKELQQVNTEVNTENISSGETQKGEENDVPQETTELYTESTATGQTIKTEENSKEDTQQDNIELYTESVGNGRIRKEEENDREDIPQETTELNTESTGNTTFDSITNHSTAEGETDIPSDDTKNTITETWSDETTTIQIYNTLDSDRTETYENMEKEASSTDATTTVISHSNYTGMLKDGGAGQYSGEVKRSSAESVTDESFQETSTDKSVFANSKEETPFESSDEDNEYITGSGAMGENNDVSNKNSSENSSNSQRKSTSRETTTIPDAHKHEPNTSDRDTVPVFTFQNDMEPPHMGIVLPDSDNSKMQVDYDIEKIETNPVEINTMEKDSNFTNNNSENAGNTSELGITEDVRVVQNSNEENEHINTDDSSTITPTSEITSQSETTERTEVSKTLQEKSTTVHDETTYSTKVHLSVASLLTHHSTTPETKAQDDEFTSPLDESTTPNVLEGEHPLSSDDFDPTTEHTESSTSEELQDITTEGSSVRGTQESKAIPYIGDDHTLHPEQGSETTAPTDETEGSTYSTTGDSTSPDPIEKILASAVAFGSNKTANYEVSGNKTGDMLPEEWLKNEQLTAEATTEVVNLEVDESQTTPNQGSAEVTVAINYSNSDIRDTYESEGTDRTDQSEESDNTTKSQWTNESISTASYSSETTDKYDNNTSSENYSQTSHSEFSNESQTTADNGSILTAGVASEEQTHVTGVEHATSTTSTYNLQENDMPFEQILSSREKYSGQRYSWKVSKDNKSDDTHEDNTGESRWGGSEETKISEAKEPNILDKTHPEYLSIEDKSAGHERHDYNEPVLEEGIEPAYYHSSGYELNYPDSYEPVEFYESGPADVSNETTLSDSIYDESTESITVSSVENDQDYMDINFSKNTTQSPQNITDLTATDIDLESTTQGLTEKYHESEETSKFSEIKYRNSLEENRNVEFENDNVDTFKLEQASFDTSEYHEEHDTAE